MEVLSVETVGRASILDDEPSDTDASAALGERISGLARQFITNAVPQLHISGIDTEFLHAVNQGAAFHAQTKRGPVWSADAAFGFLESPNDALLLLEVANHGR